VWLSSELMFFAALFAMYFTTRAVQGPEIWAQTTEVLNIPFAAFNTTVLVLSSVTCQFGVFAAERYQARRTGSLIRVSTWGMREWFSLTFLMGAFFIAGQVYEYAHLVAEGVSLSSTAYSSVFYITTGFHGLHVTGGLIAFLIGLVALLKVKRQPQLSSLTTGTLSM
jgi:cytochrome c oxidase subunit 3